jgi:exosortase A
MTAVLPIAKADTGAASGWRTHLAALAIVSAAILLIFRSDAADIVGIWLTSSTFNHCIFILPLVGWLVWQRLPELRQLEPAAWAPGLVLVALGAAGWLLGEAGSLALARHAGLVLMLQGTVVACLGKAAARGLAFPIFYAIFLVPAGEEIVPLLQTATAKMSMGLLGLAGVPAHLEGIFITTPGGYFRVAEACSGVKFLVAMLAYGALAANVCFRSWIRRALFMLAAVAIPVLANGVRAAGTVYIADRSGVEFASGFDHVFYGWIFFAIVIFLLMGAGWPFFDRKPADPWFDPHALQPGGGVPGPRPRLVGVAAATLALAALPPLWSAAVASAGTRSAPADIPLPQVAGWQRVPGDRGRPWQPHFAGADLLRIGRYRDSAGREVDLAIAMFARQEEGRELVGFGQGAAAPQGAWSWTADARPPRDGRAELIASYGTVREVVTFYRVGDILTGSAARAKLETARVRLLGGPQRAVAVLVSAEAGDGIGPRPAIDAFLKALGPADRLADEAAGLPQAR